MKPIQLTFQAFGPYADVVDIDFTRLWKHGVFTITGPNGAGKTTIFDAMAYALYGEVPGYREVNDIRSQFADAATETFVEFVFEVDGVRWLIRRTPTQLRPMIRGTGLTDKPTTVLLRRESDTAGGITKISAAKAEV
ncbi:MAG: AAA family ATPase, partial [Actinomycetes bacterium]